MTGVTKYSHRDFDEGKLAALKSGRRIYAVFSTLGDREADLVTNKISILKKLPAGIIDRIIINHRRAGDLPGRTESGISLLHKDVEIFAANDIAVPDMGSEKGKGADMRRTLYRINIENAAGIDPRNIVVVFLDADVLPAYFGSHFVTALAGAVLKGADFAKAGFWREKGRVTKYTARPLFSSVDHPSLDKLASFSYPLSGECAGTLEFFNSVSFRQVYGVETGILVEAVAGNYRLADVNLGLYDHEHNSDLAIQKMSSGVIRTYIDSLVDLGIIRLCDGARISDTFSMEFIGHDGERTGFREVLEEKKYRPLKEII